ncbi:MAG: hypothetical protein AAGI52_12255 [Bacteroidota bacterium]
MPDGYVQSYTARWSARDHEGRISLRMFGAIASNPFLESTRTLTIEDPEEFRLLLDILRNEKPLRYNSTTRALYTSVSEPVGEEET